MAKYIEREKAFELVTDLAGQASTKSAYSAFWKAANALKEIPTADVVEVKHGYFKETTEPLGARDVSCVECSVCGDSWIIEEDYSIEDYEMYWHYCPNCGAKMDKRSEGK